MFIKLNQLSIPDCVYVREISFNTDYKEVRKAMYLLCGIHHIVHK